ncbi:hypothetical protein BGZ76_006292, partial [Entomortierella beljakovae]
MKFAYSIVALVAAVVVKAQSPAFTNCGTNGTMIIDSFTLDPHPMCRGQNVCITATGVLSAPIVSGAMLYSFGSYGGSIVFADILDLCTLLADQGHPCPVPITQTAITVCFPVNPKAPVNFDLLYHISAFSNGTRMFC